MATLSYKEQAQIDRLASTRGVSFVLLALAQACRLHGLQGNEGPEAKRLWLAYNDALTAFTHNDLERMAASYLSADAPARKAAGCEEKVRKVCSHCGSENVSHDALGRWDVDAQQFELSSTLGNSDCDRCGGESTLEDAPLIYDPWAYPRALDRVIVREDSDRKVFEVYHYAPGVVRGDAELIEEFGVLQYANQAAKDFAGQFDDVIVVLEGEEYP